MQDQAFVDLIAAIGAACAVYARAKYVASAPVQDPAQPTAPAQAAQAAPAQQAPVPPTMSSTQFSAECTAVLSRHGGNQAPLVPLFARWGVTRPAAEVSPDRYPEFLSELRQAYGEPA